MIIQRQLKTLELIHKQLAVEHFYWRIGYYGLVIAGFAHFLFLLLFLGLRLYVLAAVNVLSVAIYSYCIFGLGLKTLESKDERLIGWLVYIELLGHNVLATYYLGADAGFQYYIYVLAALPFFTLTYNLFVYLFRIVSVLLVAIVLDMHSAFQTPRVDVSDALLSALYGMNLFIAFSALFFLFYLYIKEERAFHDDLLAQKGPSASFLEKLKKHK